MSKEVTKNFVCVLLKNGIEIWLEKDRTDNLKSLMESNSVNYLDLDGETISKNQIAGIFTPQRMDEYTRRRNGEWKCGYEIWHEKNKNCYCKMNGLTGEDLAKYSQGRN